MNRCVAGAVAGAMWAALAGPAAAQAGTPEPRPGQCFARVTIPAAIESYTEDRLVTPARTEVREIAPQYEMVDVSVLVAEPRIEHVVVPGVYRTVTETIVVAPERVEPVVTPAIWETYTQRLMVQPAYATWRPGCSLYGRGAGGGDLLCRTEVPARFAEVQRRRIATPETVVSRVIPVQTRQVRRQELVTPARVEARAVPATYRTVKDRRLVAPARQETVVIPEVRRTERLQRIVSPEKTEWREALCGHRATKQKLAEIQRALTSRGFSTGAADGVFGPQTLRSMEAFQRANRLGVGYLTVETVQALGVQP